MKKGLVYLLLIITSHVGAINYPYPSGGSSAGLGNITTVVNDSYAVMNNPSLIPFYKIDAINFSYTNHYFIKGVGVSQFGASYNKNEGAWFGSVQQFGFQQFNEYNVGFGYARKFGDRFFAGLTFTGLMVVAPYQENNLMQGSLQLSSYYALADDIHIGFTLFNPSAVKYKMVYYTDQIPVVFRVGIASTQIENLFLAAEAELADSNTAKLRFGAEYNFYRTCFIRTGIASNPSLISIGMGCLINQFKVEMALQNIDRLGKSAIVSLSYQF